MRVNYKKTGDWVFVKNYLDDIAPSINNLYYQAQLSIANKIVRAVKAHIRNQDLGWKPLSEATAENKGHSKVYLDTELYYSSIMAWWNRASKTTHIGVKNEFTYPNGKPISWVAALHEYGLGGMAKRPLWGPTLKEFGGASGIRDFIGDYIANHMAKKLGGVFEVDYKKHKITRR